MEEIVLDKIQRTGSRVEYHYRYPQWLARYMKKTRLFVELPATYDLAAIPDGVLTIPFVGVMLGAAMVLGLQIRVNEIDSEYYASINKIETVFSEMYPQGNIKCSVAAADKIDLVSPEIDPKKVSVFFTGGLDATSALAEIADQNPLLVNIWGGDVELADDDTHNQLEDYLRRICAGLGQARYCFVKSNCRELFDEPALDKVFRKKVGRSKYRSYWESLGDINAMCGVMAPMAWCEGIGTHYIGSSYVSACDAVSANSEGPISALAYCGCRFVSADPLLNRNEKVRKVAAFRKSRNIPIEFKVCWYRTAGKNCSECEKCYRTILNIAVNHEDPNDYGFVVDEHTFGRIKNYLRDNAVNRELWAPILQTIENNQNMYPALNELVGIRFNTPRAYIMTVLRKIASKCKR